LLLRRQFPQALENSPDLFALANGLLFLGAFRVPIQQTLADHFLAFAWQPLELRIIRHEVLLLRGRQFAQAPEDGAWSGRRLLFIAAGRGLRFGPRWLRGGLCPTRWICTLLITGPRQNHAGQKQHGQQQNPNKV
jgi:hypothetical protein